MSPDSWISDNEKKVLWFVFQPQFVADFQKMMEDEKESVVKVRNFWTDELFWSASEMSKNKPSWSEGSEVSQFKLVIFLMIFDSVTMARMHHTGNTRGSGFEPLEGSDFFHLKKLLMRKRRKKLNNNNSTTSHGSSGSTLDWQARGCPFGPSVTTKTKVVVGTLAKE